MDRPSLWASGTISRTSPARTVASWASVSSRPWLICTLRPRSRGTPSVSKYRSSTQVDDTGTPAWSARGAFRLTPAGGFVPAPTPLLAPQIDYDMTGTIPRQTPVEVVPSMVGDMSGQARFDASGAAHAASPASSLLRWPGRQCRLNVPAPPFQSIVDDLPAAHDPPKIDLRVGAQANGPPDLCHS